ncbi:MAG: hypothetical protein H0T39_10355 [Actinobacteria bacterium]|nr:hypothetical protein [Actinomycetota bacterium]
MRREGYGGAVVEDELDPLAPGGAPSAQGQCPAREQRGAEDTTSQG